MEKMSNTRGLQHPGGYPDPMAASACLVMSSFGRSAHTTESQRVGPQPNGFPPPFVRGPTATTCRAAPRSLPGKRMRPQPTDTAPDVTNTTLHQTCGGGERVRE